MSDASERRARVLSAAERLFRHYGPQKTSIADIAREAGCAVGSVYLYFASKEAILAEIALARQRAVAAAMRAAGGAEPRPVARLARMLEARTSALFRLAAEGAHAGDLVRCLDGGAGCEGGLGAGRAGKAAREAPFFGWGFGVPVREVLVEVVREGAATGELDGAHGPEVVVALIERAFATVSPPWIFRQSEDDAGRATRALAALLLHGLAARGATATRRASVRVRVRAR